MSSVLLGGTYDGRTVEDVLELDPAWVIENFGKGYNITNAQLNRAFVNLDVSLPWASEDD